MVQRDLIIVGGRTGSGKGSLPGKVIGRLGLSSSYVSIIIDDLVESNPYYKVKVSAIINKLKGEEPNPVQAFLNPSPELQKEMGTAYFNAREKVDCDTGELCTNEHTDCDTCDTKNDENMTKAFDNGQNIVFETTMTYVPSWIMEVFEKQIAEKQYKIIISYSVVDLCELLKRNKSRAVKSLEVFLVDPTKNPPRLPDIREDEYKETLLDIIEVFKNLNKNPMIESNRVRLLLFDNNTNNSKVLYDNHDNHDNHDRFDKIRTGNVAIQRYYPNKSCGSVHTKFGGYKKKLNKRSKKLNKRSKRLNKRSKKLNKRSKRLNKKTKKKK